MVDYQAHQPLEEHLAERFGEQQFDAILDCVGSHALFAKSPKYLKPDGKFVSIVGGWSQGVVPFVRSKLWPRFLGGTPRSFELFLLGASGQRAKEVAAWVEQGVIKEALVDSEYPMEQAVEVCVVKASCLVSACRWLTLLSGIRETGNPPGQGQDCHQRWQQLIRSPIGFGVSMLYRLILSSQVRTYAIMAFNRPLLSYLAHAFQCRNIITSDNNHPPPSAHTHARAPAPARADTHLPPPDGRYTDVPTPSAAPRSPAAHGSPTRTSCPDANPNGPPQPSSCSSASASGDRRRRPRQRWRWPPGWRPRQSRRRRPWTAGWARSSPCRPWPRRGSRWRTWDARCRTGWRRGRR